MPVLFAMIVISFPCLCSRVDGCTGLARGVLVSACCQTSTILLRDTTSMHMHSYTGAFHGCKLLHFNITTISIIKLNDHLAREIQEAVYIDNLDHFDPFLL